MTIQLLRKVWLAAILVWLGMSWAWAASDPAQPSARGSVTRAQFTHAVEEREPVDEVTVLDNQDHDILFYTELRGLQGHTVIHRWEYQGRVMAEIPFKVEGPRWRVFSKKTLLPEQTGIWTVVVVDEDGWPLHAEMFKYAAADSKAEQDASAVEPAPAVVPAPLETPATEPTPPMQDAVPPALDDMPDMVVPEPAPKPDKPVTM